MHHRCRGGGGHRGRRGDRFRGRCRPAFRGESDVYRRCRQQLSRAILLGLELLVAGDVVRTVAASPSLTGVAVLAPIVLIRTFLSFSLEVETTGRWPWQQRDTAASWINNGSACAGEADGWVGNAVAS
jgi:hypothetical protein